jgi:hypothetical protein
LELGRQPVPPLQRRRHPNVQVPAALNIQLDGLASCEAPGKSFLVLFFKKEHSFLLETHDKSAGIERPGSLLQ